MNIGQASAKSGVSQRMIRHYEQVGLIPPPARRDSGYRDYDERDVHRLRFVANARDLGFSVPEIGTLLELWNDQGRASAEVKNMALTHIGTLDGKIAQLQAMRATLQDLADRCNGDERPDCPILSELAKSGDPQAGEA
ncbi:Cu(I)-responsive transcriptional regulator [Novosphingobium beihaiensis]|uniref:Cu(I)-responsive transcriptional regulator n=1 Tax=Novosphingobium beihaiensis TaxID=2930389 RepID=A0ABT0BL51_9SPHN|nr:Cu(I)-responsive transcriptional regulator [Novosphingobium beihaiensis]MCJ2185788.1 Cu(I)-responsive transcriptional regulator [Novosphingobium beihaiensis]